MIKIIANKVISHLLLLLGAIMNGRAAGWHFSTVLCFLKKVQVFLAWHPSETVSFHTVALRLQ